MLVVPVVSHLYMTDYRRWCFGDLDVIAIIPHVPCLFVVVVYVYDSTFTFLRTFIVALPVVIILVD